MARRTLTIVFFGTADFAVPSLEALLEVGHTVLAVVTQPDKPKGRGMQVSASPIKLVAERHGLPLLQPRRVRAESFAAKIREMAPDALAVAAFGQIVPPAILALPPLGPINVHGSLLPKYRGAAPIQRAIIAGETEIGVTTMWMDATLDTGDMLLEGALPVAADDTAGTLTPRLAELGANLLIRTLDGLSEGTLPRRKQDDAQATLAPPILSADGLIRWNEPAAAICNRIRGVSPRPGAFASINGKRVKLWTAAVAPVAATAAEPAVIPDLSNTRTTNLRPQITLGEPGTEDPRSLWGNQPGVILSLRKTPPGVIVAAGDMTAILLIETQPENGRRMAATDWARGLRLAPGDRFDANA